QGDWVPSEGGALALPAHKPAATVENLDGSRFAVETQTPIPLAAAAPTDGLVPQRERDLAWKLHELLASPLGEGIARIVEETYRLLPRRSHPA
ncbi:helix-turn-helix domain-containing protein, partial [Singulisphaera rosea]